MFQYIFYNYNDVIYYNRSRIDEQKAKNGNLFVRGRKISNKSPCNF